MAEGYLNSVEVSGSNTLAVVVVHAECALMASTEDAAVDDVALGVGEDVVAAECVVLEGGSIVQVVYKAHHDCEVVPA